MSASGSTYDSLFKVLLVGDSGVGKSSILLRYTEDSFEDEVPATIGVDFKTKFVDVRNKKIKLTIWDTAGQERFRTLTSSYYRNAQGVILVYDVGKRDTFENVVSWLREVDTYKNVPHIVLLLVANKIDTEKAKWEVSADEGEEFAREHGMIFLQCSAKTRAGIQEAFDEVVFKILDSQATGGKAAIDAARSGVALHSRQDAQAGGRSYCC
eukprot:ANDGO_05851.mRNA.1 Ras-related protein RABC1